MRPSRLGLNHIFYHVRLHWLATLSLSSILILLGTVCFSILSISCMVSRIGIKEISCYGVSGKINWFIS